MILQHSQAVDIIKIIPEEWGKKLSSEWHKVLILKTEWIIDFSESNYSEIIKDCNNNQISELNKILGICNRYEIGDEILCLGDGFDDNYHQDFRIKSKKNDLIKIIKFGSANNNFSQVAISENGHVIRIAQYPDCFTKFKK